MTNRVAIIGGGFSGTLAAINLVRHDGPRALLIERADSIGQGLAYGAAAPGHVLNVRASNMSALPDEPDHFIRWLADQGIADPAAQFAPRRLYGRYLADLLHGTAASASDRIERRMGEVVAVERERDGALVRLADGSVERVCKVILAVGNLPPHDPPGFDARVLPADLYAANPWADGVADGLSDSDDVLLLGTGLTMIDMALLLDASGYRGRIVALSRRGLLPHAHASATPFERIRDKPVPLGSPLVRAVRTRSAAIGWRNAVDELRPFTQAIWAGADLAARRRFIRHLRPWWDVHRHRLAPQVAERIAAMQAEGRLIVRSGYSRSARAEAGRLVVRWRPRGDAQVQEAGFRRVVNCTGPAGDLSRCTEPLLRQLLQAGWIRPDPLHLGVDVDQGARTLDAQGHPNNWLLAIGPMTRGAHWEIVAVPDIRVQAWTIARRLANAHWVGGEGL
ncbi:FAD/NAD(P)-binding protein [Sphingomonas sp. BGYR3]|uniref:FAD/NAD(P)-binding protein n=1 Tax=Sphingomonas sp. BGYR3 TaxID=2975483 RepID=UPI0021A90A49|nr:FAD/NAD(P)-binding protein [Sphingomonas sp. BGYR3]MDG5487810.1 FAD/NAD(P)-binding protein [Sphingomonas sp. BGYR3]